MEWAFSLLLVSMSKRGGDKIRPALHASIGKSEQQITYISGEQNPSFSCCLYNIKHIISPYSFTKFFPWEFCFPAVVLIVLAGFAFLLYSLFVFYVLVNFWENIKVDVLYGYTMKSYFACEIFVGASYLPIRNIVLRTPP